MPLDVSGLKPVDSTKLDVSSLKPLDVSGLKPLQADAPKLDVAALRPVEEKLSSPSIIDEAIQPIKNIKTRYDKDISEGLQEMSEPVQGKVGLVDAAKEGFGKMLTKAGGAIKYLGAPLDALTNSIVSKPVAAQAPEKYRDDVEGAVDIASQMFIPELAGSRVASAIKGASKVPEAFSGFKGTEVADNAAGKMSDDLFRITQNNKADRLEMLQKMKGIKKIPEQTWERLQRYEESKGKFPLTPEEKALYEKEIAPMATESEGHAKYLKDKGYDIGGGVDEQVGYTPRQVKGKGGVLDKILGDKTGVGRKGLSKNASAAKPRSMFAMEALDGERSVVDVRDGKVKSTSEKGTQIGRVKYPKDGKGAAMVLDKNGNRIGTIRQATIDEIQDATGINYHRNLLGTRTTSLMQLRRARRNAEYIERLKLEPDFGNIASTDAKNAPENWREVANLPQFRNYRWRPDIADTLEDFVGDAKTNSPHILDLPEKVGRLAKASLFYNPLPHMRNVLNHYFVSKGLVGTTMDVAKGAMGLAKGESPSAYEAIKSVMTQGKDYQDYLRSGASLPGADIAAQKFQKELIRAMGEEAQKNPKEFGALAKVFGYANPVALIKGVYSASNKALWSVSDMIALTRIKELEKSGLTRAAAIKEAERGIPNYRIPSQVLGKRSVSQVLQNPALSMFGRYQYGRMRSYGETMKDLLGKDKTIKDRAKALDQIAMMGFMMYVSYPLLNKAAQEMTGNTNAEVTYPGAVAIPHALGEVARGNRTFGQALGSAFSPGVLSTPAEIISNTHLGTGKDVYQPKDVEDLIGGPDRAKAGERILYDTGSLIANKFAPIQEIIDVVKGDKTKKQLLEEQIGIKDPSDDKMKKKKRRADYVKSAQKSAAKKRGF